MHISTDTTIATTGGGYKIFDPSGKTTIRTSSFNKGDGYFTCSNGGIFFSLNGIKNSGSFKAILSFNPIGNAKVVLKENQEASNPGFDLSGEIKGGFAANNDRIGISVVFTGGVVDWCVYNFRTRDSKVGSEVYTASSLSELNVYLGYATIYDIYLSEEMYDSASALSQLKSLVQIAAVGNVGYLNAYRATGSWSVTDGSYTSKPGSLHLNASDYRFNVPNLFVADNLNSSEKLVFTFKPVSTDIWYYNDNRELSIKQYLSRQHYPSYYYERTTDKTYISNIEYSGSSVIYVSNYIGTNVVLVVPMESRDEYTVTAGESSITFDTYGKAVVTLGPGSTEIIANRGSDTVSFTVYNIGNTVGGEYVQGDTFGYGDDYDYGYEADYEYGSISSSSKISIEYIEWNSWANYKLANGDITGNTLANLMTYLNAHKRKTTATVDNIAPAVYKVPIAIMCDKSGHRNVLIENAAVPFVNHFSENIINLE